MLKSISHQILFLSSIIIFGCENETYSVELTNIEDNLATFEVVNHTANDLSAIDFELTYFNSGGDIIEIDTVKYSMDEESPVEIFLKAEGQTYFSQQVPENTATAAATPTGTHATSAAATPAATSHSQYPFSHLLLVLTLLPVSLLGLLPTGTHATSY